MEYDFPSKLGCCNSYSVDFVVFASNWLLACRYVFQRNKCPKLLSLESQEFLTVFINYKGKCFSKIFNLCHQSDSSEEINQVHGLVF